MNQNFIIRTSVFAFIFFCLAVDAQAQDFFKSAPGLKKDFSGRSRLSKYSLFTLNETQLRTYLNTAPAEFKNSNKKVLLKVPLPDGTSEVFDIKESSVLSPQVAAEHPEIKSYTGQGQTHANYVIRLSFTSSGFNGIIVGLPADEVYIEKDQANKQKNVYAIYFGRDSKRLDKPQKANNKCGALGSGFRGSTVVLPGSGSGMRVAATGGTLRTFRLAVAATAEFTAAKGGTQTAAFNALVAYVNRLVAIYRLELSVSFTLVSGTNLVYTTPGVPYTSSDQTLMLSQNQENIDNVIGNANYDIGHLLGSEGGSGGGLAASPSACITGEKAQGLSAVGDGSFAAIFDDQLIAHEIGHQFGMSHSYNSSIPVCTTREPGTSVEPGSGTTIMSYGYTCNDNTGNDDYDSTFQPILNFHTVSYKQAVDYITTITCFTSSSTGNTPPVITTSTTAKTIPKSTPFALTGTSTDVDSTNVLSYSWESIDTGTTVPTPTTLADDTESPFFRSYAPTATPTRLYPRLNAILDGSNKAKGDKLPSIGVVTKHRFTVRDNKDGVDFSEVSITVDANSGPFLETTNLSGTYESGSTQTITWDVAQTDGAPVNSPNVDILLSIDSGQTFITILKAATPNDGTETVTLPYLPTTTNNARIKVMSSNNIFFDISNSNFTINAGINPLPLNFLTIQANKQAANISVIWNTAAEKDLRLYEVEYSTDGVTFTKVGNVAARNNAGPNTYSFLHIQPVASLNYYRVKTISVTGENKYSRVVMVRKDNNNNVVVTVYPNPVTDGFLGLQFNNLLSEKYTVNLFSISGQRVMSKIINHIGGSSSAQINLNDSRIAAGTYQLVITGSLGTNFKQKILIQ